MHYGPMLRRVGRADRPLYGIEVRLTGEMPLVVCNLNEPDHLAVIRDDPETIAALAQPQRARVKLGPEEQEHTVQLIREHGRFVLTLS